MPTAMTDENGVFELSSFGGNDGAAEGEYAAVFYWPDNLMAPGRDRFQGRFNNPDKSEFRVTIPPEQTTLPPFEIKIPEKQLLPSVFGLNELKAAAESQKKHSGS